MSIRWKGNLENFSQLEQGYFPEDAIQVEEPNTLEEIVSQSIKENLGVLITTFLLSIVRLVVVPAHTSFELGISGFMFFCGIISIYFILMYVHELIHALFYPLGSNKEIWMYQWQAMLVHCQAQVSRRRFVWMSLAPVTILGFVPFVLWLFLSPMVSFGVSMIWMLESWAMIFGGIGDIYNVRNILAQVPKDAHVFNYGLHTYWLT